MDIEIFGNQKNPKVIVIGVFHGDEPQGNFLIRNYLENHNDTQILFVPCLNNSGYLSGTRVNANGVDLNRNFPTKNWVVSSEKDDYYSGISPASEEETQFVIALIEKYSPKAILTLHSPYKIVNYDGDNNGEALKLAEKISSIIKYPIQKDIGYPTPGSFGTWAGIERDIPTITLELDENCSIEALESPVFEIFKMLENY